MTSRGTVAGVAVGVLLSVHVASVPGGAQVRGALELIRDADSAISKGVSKGVSRGVAACAWYSTDSAVSCMNASSREACWGLSSCSTIWCCAASSPIWRAFRWTVK